MNEVHCPESNVEAAEQADAIEASGQASSADIIFRQAKRDRMAGFSCAGLALPPVILIPSHRYMSMRAFRISYRPSPLRGRRPRFGLPTVSWVGCIVPGVVGLLGLGLGGSSFGL